VCVRVCVCARAQRRYVFVRICICIFRILFVCVRAIQVSVQQGGHIAHKLESGWEVGVIKAVDEGPSRWQVQREVQG
jgi:hypothetical protein